MDLGPLEIFYCWQSIVLSCGVHVGTRSLKNAVLLLAGQNSIKMAWGKEVVIPVIPLFLGIVSGVFIPLRSDYLTAYVATNNVQTPWLVYAAYGASIGTFADYIHQRIAGALKLKSAHTTKET